MANHLLVVSFIFLCQILFAITEPLVRVEQGLILGKTVHFENDYLDVQEDVDVFLGIPFAEPPVGDLRFEAPLPKEPWAEDDVYNATYIRDFCVQASEEASFYGQSEDCLYLNIYVPNPKVIFIIIY